MSWFITGTDTGVGKTYVTALLVEGMRTRGIDAVACKPVCSGGREDAERLAEASGGVSVDEVNPVWLQSPVAPYVAGLLENRQLGMDELLAPCRRLLDTRERVLVEGVGGWEVPLAPGLRVADLAAELGLPVVVVVANRLGALNHALLTVRAVQARGLRCEGLVLNQLEDELDTAAITNKGVIEDLAGVPLLAHVIHGQDRLEIW
jgi:dethiobiotin synthetase